MNYVFLILSIMFITCPVVASQKLQLTINALPPDSAENLILLKAFSLTNGIIVSSTKEQASSELLYY